MFCYNTENTRSLGVRHLLDRLSSWVVRARRGILAVFLILGVLSAFLMAAVQVNYDLTAYLPQDMPTTKALTLMDDTFGYTGMAQVMLEDMSIDEILEMKAQIAAVDGVSMVMWLDDVADVRAPLSTLDASVGAIVLQRRAPRCSLCNLPIVIIPSARAPPCRRSTGSLAITR